MSPLTYKVYLAWFFGIIVFLLLACAFLNWYVDPYDLFDRPRSDSVNALKPTADTRVRYSKPYRVDLLKPKTLILGNSRPEMGLDPAYDCWPKEMSPVYNLAMPGIGLYEIYRNFQHATAVSNVEYLILGLDFLFFTHADIEVDPHSLEMPPSDQEHLRVLPDGSTNPYYFVERAKNLFRALFSLQALTDSLTTLRSQGMQFVPTIDPNGYNPEGSFPEIIATEGQQVLFAQKNREIAEMLVGEKTLFQGGDNWSTSLEITRRILDLAKERGIKSVLFINPRHADWMNLVEISGKWPLLENWKRVMTQLVEPYDAQLWDFHGFNEYASTAAPAQRGQVLEGFWEPGHYRRPMGNAMIDAIFENSCHKAALFKAGVLIDETNIEAHLLELKGQLKLYEDRQPDSKQALKELFKQAAHQPD